MGVKSWLGFEEGTGGGGSSKDDETVNLDEYLESIGLHEGELLDEEKYTYVKSLTANSPDVFTDVERELRKGNIILLDTEAMSQTNRLSLKKLISDLKNLEGDIDGDMGRVSETKILIVPGSYRILKRRFE